MNWKPEPIAPKDKAPKTQLINIRMPVDLKSDLEQEAERLTRKTGKRIGYQTLAIQVLQQWSKAMQETTARPSRVKGVDK